MEKFVVKLFLFYNINKRQTARLALIARMYYVHQVQTFALQL